MEWPTRECGNTASVQACNLRPPWYNSAIINFLTRLRFYHNRKFSPLLIGGLMANLFQILNQFVILFRKNVIEKSFINWRVLPLVKINARISDTPVLYNIFMFQSELYRNISQNSKVSDQILFFGNCFYKKCSSLKPFLRQ
jgi:hypothetical protein